MPRLSNFVALDLGSSKIAGLVAHIDKNGKSNILSQNLHNSKGIKSSAILDLQDAETSIISAIYSLEKDYGKNIQNVSIALTGAGTKSYYLNGKLKLSGQQVSKDDVKQLMRKILSNFNIQSQEILHYFPIEFTIDNRYITNPIGMIGSELSCELHIIAANKLLLQNIINCFSKCHVEVSSIILAIYASGLACLTHDEKEHGVVIIDMGAKTTSFAIFLNGKLLYTNYIDIGSFHITLDIAKIFGVSFAVAEKLKILYGNATTSSFEKDNIINLDEFEVEIAEHTLPINSQNLAAVINSRAEEILHLVDSIFTTTIAGQIVSQKIVLTGGGAMLRGMKELASTILGKQVRLGKPEIVPGFGETCNPYMHSTSIGMVKHQSLKQINRSVEIDLFEKSNMLQKIFSWIKKNI